jgi:hypothetical protein
MNLSLILHPLDYSASAKPALARAPALDSGRHSMGPGRASKANPIGDLAS